MIQKFELDLPPTLNEQIRHARGHWSKSAKLKKQHTQLVACAATIHLKPFNSSRYYMHFFWKIKNFGRDPDNVTAAAKFILDGLQEAGIIASDNLAHVVGPYVHEFSRGADTVEVWISDEPIAECKLLQTA